jgi:hypothetical protein
LCSILYEDLFSITGTTCLLTSLHLLIGVHFDPDKLLAIHVGHDRVRRMQTTSAVAITAAVATVEATGVSSVTSTVATTGVPTSAAVTTVTN